MPRIHTYPKNTLSSEYLQRYFTSTSKPNGQEGEVFLKAPSPTEQNQDVYELVEVPKGHIWVEGDYPEMSVDSRTFGALPLNMVQGSPVFKV